MGNLQTPMIKITVNSTKTLTPRKLYLKQTDTDFFFLKTPSLNKTKKSTYINHSYNHNHNHT